MSDQPKIAYKILTREQFATLQEKAHFEGAPVDREDGYIHMSTADQVTETADKHFAGQDDLVIAAVDLAGLGDAVKWEESRGGALFPHLYAPLPLTAILRHGPLERKDDGQVKLPG